MTGELQISELSVYPVKSLAGVSVERAALTPFGLAGDRRWMLVDDQGLFITQRDHPHLARCKAQSGRDSLTLQWNDATLTVPIPDGTASTRAVEVWGDGVAALDAGNDAAQWCQQYLQLPCRLVYMPETAQRLADPEYARPGQRVSFADGFPLLLISHASLDELNRRLPEPVPMNRFRPNIVVSGCQPFAEDEWRRIQIGDQVFSVAKPCSRCVMPSIDQATGARDRDINRVLASFRRWEGQIWFGQNLSYDIQRDTTTEIATGQSVRVLD